MSTGALAMRISQMEKRQPRWDTAAAAMVVLYYQYIVHVVGDFRTYPTGGATKHANPQTLMATDTWASS